jgi:hypothetical protein
MMNPKYPIYIISKGRWTSDCRLTAKSLEDIKVPYFITVEEQEYENYLNATNPEFGTVLILDKKFQDEYDTCDDLGSTKSKGPGAARNFCWDHAIKNGHKRHWVMDDNMVGFFRLNHNIRVKVSTGKMFRAAEDFVDRFTNVPISGLNYRFLATPTEYRPPFVKNTRIYSCLLIENDIPYRWRGRYNEDTDLSLRVLKDGLCTIQFNAFLCGKVGTQQVKGGNTEAFYAHEGTMAKSQMQVYLHPDVSKLLFRFNRWHHYVDYSPFKNNMLIRRPDLILSTEINNYDMKLITKEKNATL